MWGWLVAIRDGIRATHIFIEAVVHAFALKVDAAFDSLDCEEIPNRPGNLSTEIHCQVQDEAPCGTSKDVASDMLETPTDGYDAHHLGNVLEQEGKQHVIHYLRRIATIGDYVRENHPNHYLHTPLQKCLTRATGSTCIFLADL